MVEYLLSIGADATQLAGKTGYALHAACRAESEDGLKIIKMLLEHGAGPNSRGGKYETALQAASTATLEMSSFCSERAPTRHLKGVAIGPRYKLP